MSIKLNRLEVAFDSIYVCAPKFEEKRNTLATCWDKGYQ